MSVEVYNVRGRGTPSIQARRTSMNEVELRIDFEDAPHLWAEATIEEAAPSEEQSKSKNFRAKFITLDILHTMIANVKTALLDDDKPAYASGVCSLVAMGRYIERVLAPNNFAVAMEIENRLEFIAHKIKEVCDKATSEIDDTPTIEEN